MAELFEHFGNAESLGIILLAGSVCLLLTPDFYSWFLEDSRRFWRPKLTYEDSDTQSFVRACWLSGIAMLILGAVIVAVNDPRNPEGSGWVYFEIAYLIVCAWIMRKLILLAAIIISSVWNWVMHGTPLLKKKEIQKGDA